MHMLYNSDSFAVVAFDLPSERGTEGAEGAGGPAEVARGGFEIVDKFAKKDIFLAGAVAESFKTGAEALMATQPSQEDIDEFIGRFTAIGAQPLVLH